MNVGAIRILMAVGLCLFTRLGMAQGPFEDPDAFIRYDTKAWMLSEFRSIDAGPGIVLDANWLNDDLIFVRKLNTELSAKTAPFLVGEAKPPSNLRESFSVFNRATRKLVEIATLAPGQMFLQAESNKSGSIIAISFTTDPEGNSVGVIFGNTKRGGSILRLENPDELVTPLIGRGSEYVGLLIGKGSIATGLQQELYGINPETNQLVKASGPSLTNQILGVKSPDPATGEWYLGFKGVQYTIGNWIVWDPVSAKYSSVDKKNVYELAFLDDMFVQKAEFSAGADLNGNATIESVLNYQTNVEPQKRSKVARIQSVDKIQLAPDLPFGLMIRRGQVSWFEIVPVDIKVLEYAELSSARKLAVLQAKQCGLALIMYASDNDDVLPDSAGVREAILPYLKDSTIASRLVLTMPRANMSEIEDPAQTRLGYVEGPGGRAIIYADGHVKWVPD